MSGLIAADLRPTRAIHSWFGSGMQTRAEPSVAQAPSGARQGCLDVIT